MIPLNAVVVAGLPKNLPNRYARGTQQFPRVIWVPINGSHWLPSKRLGMLLEALKLFLRYQRDSHLRSTLRPMSPGNPTISYLIIDSYPHNSPELNICLAPLLASFSLTTLPSISSLSALTLPSIKH